MYGYVYKTTNLVNGKIYVGQHRCPTFDTNYYGSGANILKAIDKYGIDSFKCELIEECSNDQELNEKEIFYIALYDSTDRNKGYNLTAGGQGTVNYRHTIDAKLNISKHNAKYWKGKQLSTETKQKLSQSHIGLVQSIETREKRSKALLGHKCWVKVSPMKGKHLSDETRAKLSQSHLGQIPVNKGQKMDESFCKRVSELTKLAMQKPEIKAKLSSRPRTSELKQKLSNAIKGRKFVTNGFENHQVKPEELSDWINRGYWLGLTKRSKR